MKKYFILAAAALTVFAACTKVEVAETPAKKISFNATTYTAQTKADPGTTSSLYSEGVSAFNSKAFLHANGAAEGTDFFGATGDTVRYIAGTPAVWEPILEYFWPKASDSYINFVSWYTKNAKAQLSASDITETAMNWGDTDHPVTIVANDNILFADEAWRFKDNVNPGTYRYDDVAEGVPTLFHHALAKLAFNVKLSTTTQSTKTIWDVDIQTASLKIGNNGYLALTNEAPAGTNAAISAWKVGGSAATSEIVGWARPSSPTLEQIVETTSEASDVTKSFVKCSFEGFAPKTDATKTTTSQVFLEERTVMPQTLGSTVKFAMTFTIKLYHDSDNDGAKDGAAYSEETITIAEQDLTDLVATPAAWNMNTKVTYNITIDPVGKKVLFDPAVVDWATVNTDDTQIY